MKALITGSLLLGTVLLARADSLAPEKQVEYRQAGYRYMAWNMGRIKEQLDGGHYDARQVQAAAGAIASIASSGMGALYGPGTATDKLGDKTRLKPEFFAQRDKAAQLAGELNTATRKLASAAAKGDRDALRIAFGETGAACKACYSAFRN